MARLFTPILVLVCAAALLVSWSAIRAEDEKKPVLVVNMTAGSDDMHSVWMGLRLAEHALDGGRAAIVFMNVKAPPLASKKCPDDCRFGEMPPVKEQIATLVKKGGSVIVCPECAKANGVAEADLLPGVELATKEKLFGRIDGDTVVFSY